MEQLTRKFNQGPELMNSVFNAHFLLKLVIYSDRVLQINAVHSEILIEGELNLADIVQQLLLKPVQVKKKWLNYVFAVQPCPMFHQIWSKKPSYLCLHFS